MSNQYIGIAGNFLIVTALAVSYAVTHKHRNTIKLHTFNLNSGVAEIMDVTVQSVNAGSIETVVMVATDKDFVAVGQVTKPIEKIKGFLFGSYHAEVT